MDSGNEGRFLRIEIAEERRTANLGHRADVLDPDGVEAVLGDQRHRRLGDRHRRALFLELSQGGRRRHEKAVWHKIWDAVPLRTASYFCGGRSGAQRYSCTSVSRDDDERDGGDLMAELASRAKFDELLALLKDAADTWVTPGPGMSDDDVAEGFRNLTHILQSALYSHQEFDPDRPVFRRIVSPTRSFTGDNSDAL